MRESHCELEEPLDEPAAPFSVPAPPLELAPPLLEPPLGGVLEGALGAAPGAEGAEPAPPWVPDGCSDVVPPGAPVPLSPELQPAIKTVENSTTIGPIRIVLFITVPPVLKEAAS